MAVDEDAALRAQADLAALRGEERLGGDATHDDVAPKVPIRLTGSGGRLQPCVVEGGVD